MHRQPSVKWIETKYAEIKQKVVSYVGVILTKELLISLCQIIASVCTGSPQSRKKFSKECFAALLRTVEPLEGTTQTEVSLWRNIYRIIANWDFIKQETAVPQWYGEPIWCDAVILGLKNGVVIHHGKPAYYVKIKLKNGLGSGIILWVLLSTDRMESFMRSHSGCFQIHPSPEEISGMAASLLVSSDGKLGYVKEWSCTQSQKEKNKKLCTARSDMYRCSTATIPCMLCKKTTKECPLAIWV